MNLSDIRDWLRTKVDCPQWFLNQMTTKTDQCIAIYNSIGAAPRMAIGGLENTSYTNKPISILIHWGKSPSAAETKAKEVYDLLFGQSTVIAGKRVIMFETRHTEPLSLGTDSEGIYEFLIEVNLIHER